MPKTPADQEPEAPVSLEAEIENIVPKGAKFEGSYGNSVRVRVTKFGAGKVSTGVHIPEVGDKMAEKDEILIVDQSVADALEKKGFAEIAE